MRKELWEFTDRSSHIWLRPLRRTSRRRWLWRGAWKDWYMSMDIITGKVNSRLLSKSYGTGPEMEHILQMASVGGVAITVWV